MDPPASRRHSVAVRAGRGVQAARLPRKQEKFCGIQLETRGTKDMWLGLLRHRTSVRAILELEVPHRKLEVREILMALMQAV